jgi:Na+/proline symporter
VNTYKVTLVAAFIPLFAGLYWKRATTQGALWAIVAGLTSWLALELVSEPTDVCPPQLVGFAMAGFGMLAGSLWPNQRGESQRPMEGVKAGLG